MTVVFAIFAVKNRCSFARDLFLEGCELVEEWLCEIEFLTKVQRVPGISPPDWIVVYFESAIRLVCAQNFFACFVAFSFIKFPFVACRKKFS